ncbi:MAG: ABC transporter ATP-binding protein [Zavarzinella sp.]
MNDQPIIELQNICRTFGSATVLTDITLQLQAGRIGLLGQNGAGKSTLMKILLGLLSPTSGHGMVLGHPIVPNRSDEGDLELRRVVGYMPEVDALVPGLRGIEYVTLAAQMYGLRRKEALRRAHEVLYHLQLDEARYRLIAEYSLGMKQRLKLAQALVHDPALLLLDEPTSGLDPEGRRAMLDLLLELGTKHGKTIILSTHLLGDVSAVCEQVLILAHGHVRGQGSVASLLTHQHRRFQLRIAGEAERFLAELRKIGVAIDSARTYGEYILQLPDSIAENDLFRFAAQCGVTIRKLTPDEETMNDLFLRSVG